MLSIELMLPLSRHAQYSQYLYVVFRVVYNVQSFSTRNEYILQRTHRRTRGHWDVRLLNCGHIYMVAASHSSGEELEYSSIEVQLYPAMSSVHSYVAPNEHIQSQNLTALLRSHYERLLTEMGIRVDASHITR